MTVLCGSHLGDGLTIRNLRCEEFYIQLVLVVDEPFYDVDVLLAVSAEDGLAEFLGILYYAGRILGADLLEGLAQFLLVLLDFGLDGAAVLGSGILDLVVLDS